MESIFSNTDMAKKIFENFIVNGKKGGYSICSTCKYFDGKSCSKGRSFGGFATKLDDCGEWEVCGG